MKAMSTLKLKKNVDVPVIQAFQIETREDLNKRKKHSRLCLMDSGAGTERYLIGV